MTTVVVGMNFFHDGLQNALDPRRIRPGCDPACRSS
jgi:hypothetical protein